jgi:mRNA-degrading endonuclease RelE of RelBE toxin-antitoxin system
MRRTKPEGDIRSGAVAYAIELTPQAAEHLGGLKARDRVTLLDQLARQLSREPTVETRNRKPMRPNPLAPWELRVGHLRVYYDVSDNPSPIVTVRAFGIKVRNRVRIGVDWWEPGKAEEPEKEHEDLGDKTGDG